METLSAKTRETIYASFPLVVWSLFLLALSSSGLWAVVAVAWTVFVIGLAMHYTHVPVRRGYDMGA